MDTDKNVVRATARGGRACVEGVKRREIGDICNHVNIKKKRIQDLANE